MERVAGKGDRRSQVKGGGIRLGLAGPWPEPRIDQRLLERPSVSRPFAPSRHSRRRSRRVPRCAGPEVASGAPRGRAPRRCPSGRPDPGRSPVALLRYRPLPRSSRAGEAPWQAGTWLRLRATGRRALASVRAPRGLASRPSPRPRSAPRSWRGSWLRSSLRADLRSAPTGRGHGRPTRARLRPRHARPSLDRGQAWLGWLRLPSSRAVGSALENVASAVSSLPKKVCTQPSSQRQAKRRAASVPGASSAEFGGLSGRKILSLKHGKSTGELPAAQD